MPIFKINFFLIFFWAILTYFLPLTQKKKNLVFLGIVFFQFTFLAWQRDFSVGHDTNEYYEIFKMAANYNIARLQALGIEPAYSLMNKIVGWCGGSFHTFLLFAAIFIYYSFIRFIYKYSQCIWLSIIIYIAFGWFFESLYILRQFIAVSIILFSYDFLLKRRFLQFSLLVVFASLFHYSAIAFIFTYLIWSKIPYKSTYLVFIFLISVFISFVIGDFLLHLFILNEKYRDTYINDNSSGSGYNMLILMSMIMFLGILLRPKSITKKDRLFYNIYFIALCLQPLATIVSMVSRGILYWSMSLTVFLPTIIVNIKEKTLRLFVYSIVVVGLITFFLIISNSQEGIEVEKTYRFYIGE